MDLAGGGSTSQLSLFLPVHLEIGRLIPEP